MAKFGKGLRDSKKISKILKDSKRLQMYIWFGLYRRHGMFEKYHATPGQRDLLIRNIVY